MLRSAANAFETGTMKEQEALMRQRGPFALTVRQRELKTAGDEGPGGGQGTVELMNVRTRSCRQGRTHPA